MTTHWTQNTYLSDMRSFTIKLHAITPSGKFYSKVYKNFLSHSKLIAKQTTTFLLIRQGFTDVRVVGVWKDVL